MMGGALGVSMRGLWRWWETKDGVDIWRARVETSPGAWSDLTPEEYAAQGCAPAFWDLPLQGDHLHTLVINPAVERHYTVEQRAGEFTTMSLMLIGGLVFAIAVVGLIGFALFGRFTS